MTTSTDEPRSIGDMIETWRRRGEEQLAALTPEQRAARDAQIAAEEQREARERFEQRMARIVPPMFRDAEVTRPEIKEWLAADVRDLSVKTALLLTGTVGAGKTFEAYGIIKHFLALERSVEYEVAPNLFLNLQPGALEDRAAYVQRLKSCTLLVIDDLGAHKDTEPREEALFLILDERYRWRRRTVLISNVVSREISKVVGDRLADRFTQICRSVPFNNESRRRP